MSFDVHYVSLLISKLEPIEAQFQNLAAERDYLLRLLAEHTHMIGEVPHKLNDKQTEILYGFVDLFKRSYGSPSNNNALSTVPSVRGRCFSFGGVKDD